jgi:hypothetical protein
VAPKHNYCLDSSICRRTLNNDANQTYCTARPNINGKIDVSRKLFPNEAI